MRWPDRVGAETVPAVTLDGTLAPGTRVRLVKVDVQGDELRVLRGMQRVLDDSPDVCLLLECFPHGLATAGGSVDEYEALLRGQGFSRPSGRGCAHRRAALARAPARRAGGTLLERRGGADRAAADGLTARHQPAGREGIRISPSTTIRAHAEIVNPTTTDRGRY
jgi:hypothetical protein